MRHAVLIAVLLAACATAAPVAEQSQAAEQSATQRPAPHPMFAQPGYLAQTAIPDFVTLMGPPPAAGSPAEARDEEARNAALRLRNTPRFAQAAVDADLRAANPPAVFSCAANANISPETTPRTSALLMRVGVDFGRSTSAVKAQYRRTRPFAQHNATSCTPAEEAVLRNDGSYPSGHSAIGWGWALVLAELFPDHANEILQRGRDFGQSRVVCDVHWQSDVEGGRTVAAAVTARLHADPAFRADLEAARAELAASRPPAPDANACSAEAAALRAAP